MATFLYKALAADGTLTEGRLDAGGRQEAMRQLQGQGLRPVRLDEGVRAAAAARKRAKIEGDEADGGWTLGSRKVPQKALEAFFRQLSSLLKAGVPLSRGLQILSRESSTPLVTRQWKAIHDMVIDGTSLADAMGRLPDTFPAVHVAMVKAGETGGFLDVVLNQIADFQARDRELKSKVQAAMLYPEVLAFLVVGVLIFLLTFFIPRIQSIFSGLGGTLPLLTRIIIAASELVREYGLIVAALVAVGVYAVRQWSQSEQGRRTWERTLLKLPSIGPLTARFAMTRFCRMLGTLITSGVPLITALRVARDSLGNQTLVDAIEGSIERVQQGEPLAASLADCPQLFPGSTVEMISVAEESGRMDEELIRIANETETELDRQLRTAVSLAEPVMLFVMAGIIGTIFIGMVIPIFSIQEQIK
jgi:type II secretory pathway component PulF